MGIHVADEIAVKSNLLRSNFVHFVIVLLQGLEVIDSNISVVGEEVLEKKGSTEYIINKALKSYRKYTLVRASTQFK